jgi:hypothetical protein
MLLIAVISTLGCATWPFEPSDAEKATASAAQLAQGLQYLNAEGVEADVVLAADWFRKAAENGNPEAQRRLAFAYQNGEGVPLDRNEAIGWYLKAARQEDSASQAAVGRLFLTGEGVEKRTLGAMHWLREAALAGESDAQFLLGRAMLHGVGRSLVPRKPKLGAKWLLAASEQGVAAADYELGAYYHKRKEKPGRLEMAVERLQAAAAQDHPAAHTLLSTLFQIGEGVAVDEAESIRLLRKGARLGDLEAQNELAKLLREGSRVEQNEAESFEWFKKAATQGHTDAQLNLSRAYLQGAGVEQDLVRGFAWIEVCVAKNIREAIRERHTARGTLSPDQLEAAQKLYEELSASLPTE